MTNKQQAFRAVELGDGKALSLRTGATVGQVAQRNILRCDPSTPLHEAAERMWTHHCSCIVVFEEDQMVGIWTERDATCLDFTVPEAINWPIRQVMSSPVVTLPSDTPLEDLATRVQKHGVRHFVVVDERDGSPQGVITQTDVVVHQGMEHFLTLRTVDSVVRRDVPRLGEERLLSDAPQLMRRSFSDAVLVDYRDGDTGIVTERDMVRFVASGLKDSPLGEVASRPLFTVPASESLARTRDLLAERGLRHVGATDGGRIIGIVSFAEILSGIEVDYLRELGRVLRERDVALAQSRRSLHVAEQIIENSLQGVMITDSDGVIQRVNPAFTRLTGYTPEEAVGRTPALLSSGRQGPEFYDELWRSLKERGHWEGELWNRRRSGEIYPQFLSIVAIRDEEGQVLHYAGQFNDISELKRREEKIRHLAYYDPLTGLPNRRLLDDRLAIALANANRHGRKLAIMFVDLNDFKYINDTYGHQAGDAILEQVAARLLGAVRAGDTVARFAGDEFVLLCLDPHTEDELERIMERVHTLMEAPFPLEGRELALTVSMGQSMYPDDGETADDLLRRADAAMYEAKRRRNRPLGEKEGAD